MKTKKQVEAWLSLKLRNLEFVIGGSTSYSKIGLKRIRTRLQGIIDQLDEYLKEGIR